MKIANISIIKNQLSRYLKYVQKGERVRIFDRNEPVADLVPVEAASSDTPGSEKAFLARLETRGVARRGTGRIPKELLTPLSGKATDGVTGVLDALLAERKQGR